MIKLVLTQEKKRENPDSYKMSSQQYRCFFVLRLLSAFIFSLRTNGNDNDVENEIEKKSKINKTHVYTEDRDIYVKPFEQTLARRWF